MNYEEIINAMAKGIFDEYYPCGHTGAASFEDAPESEKRNLRRNAEAALRALQDAMPQAENVTKKMGENGLLLYNNGEQLYNELKNLGR